MEGAVGMRKEAWAPGQNWAKVCENGRGGWSCCCQMSAGHGADVWAPGSGTNTMNSTRKIATPGQNSDELVDGNRERDGEKLDPLDAKQIHGSNPTKLHQINKSPKNWGYFWWGIFGFRTKNNKIKLENTG